MCITFEKVVNASYPNCRSIVKCVSYFFYWFFKERELLIEAQRKVEDTHNKLYSFEAELSALKEEKETLQLKLKEERGRINILDQQKKSLQATLDEYKKKEVCFFYV
jgi:peptidoglycan hydrolase CwlO-like protein